MRYRIIFRHSMVAALFICLAIPAEGPPAADTTLGARVDSPANVTTIPQPMETALVDEPQGKRSGDDTVLLERADAAPPHPQGGQPGPGGTAGHPGSQAAAGGTQHGQQAAQYPGNLDGGPVPLPFNAQHYINHGQQSLAAMDITAVQLQNRFGITQDVSDFTYTDLATTGWVRTTPHMSPTIFSPQGMCPILTALVRFHASHQLAGPGTVGGNRLVEWKHPFAGNAGPNFHNGIIQTDAAEYTNIYDPRQGTLIALAYRSPREAINADATLRSQLPAIMPRITEWSQVSLSEFNEQRASLRARNAQHLRHIFFVQVSEPETQRVVEWVLDPNAGNNQHVMPPPTGAARRFDVNTAQGQALLGTPIGTRVAMLLLQNKTPMKRFRTLRDIYVFRDDSVQGDTDWQNYRGPTLLFELDVAPSGKVGGPAKGGPSKAGAGSGGSGAGSRRKRPANEVS